MDSLLTLFKTHPDNLKKAATYYHLAWYYRSANAKADMVRKYADSITIRSRKLVFEKMMA